MTAFLVALGVLALAAAVPPQCLAQTTATTPPAEPSLRTFFTDLAGDVRRLPSNPAGVSVVSGELLSVSLSRLDDDLAQWQPEGIFELGTWLNGPALAGITLASYGLGRWTHKPRVSHIAVDVLRAQVLSLGLTYGLKQIVRRERPDHSSDDSFPSGHAAQTFASATVIARHLGPQTAWPGFVVASFVALSRMNQQRHFFSDVVFGAGLGVAVGWNSGHEASPWTVAPHLSRSRVSVQISREFWP
jgi:membrane-associated phospholipid phosphatase